GLSTCRAARARSNKPWAFARSTAAGGIIEGPGAPDSIRPSGRQASRTAPAGACMLEPRTVTRAAVTRDTLFGGQLHLTQPARGYRTNVDALLLAHFAALPGRAQLAVDLGAGV